ncbi:MAG TPA: EAL domain-containing protein [Noviherbaspirillum sp.]
MNDRLKRIKSDGVEESKAKHPGFYKSSCEFAASAAQVGMWDLHLPTDRVMICENLSRLMGLPAQPHDLSSSEWRNFVHPDDLSGIEQLVAHSCKSDEPFNMEYRVTATTGSTIWLHSRGRIKRDDDGHAVRLIGLSFDITARKAVEEALRESEARFRLLADQCPEGIFVIAHGKYVYANAAAGRMVGAEDRLDLVRFRPEDFVDRAVLETVRYRAKEQLARDINTRPFTVPFRRLDGADAVAEVSYGRIMWNGLQAYQILCRDVTDQRKTEEKLRVTSERLKLAVEGSGEGIWDRDLVTGTYELSGGVKEILGYPEHAAPHLGAEWGRLIHPDDRSRVHAAFHACASGEAPVYRCEYRVRANDGSWKWVSSRGVVVTRDEHGKPTAMTGTITDVTAKRESEEIVWRHANLDPLTGLPNRRHVINQVAAELRKVSRTGAMTALLFIDLDGFKQVNDLFGHEAGDALLMEAARRIRNAVRETDCLGRLGGDEFTVLLRDLHSEDRVEYVCQTILASLSQSFHIHAETAYISASIGVAFAPLDAATADELLRKADTAMYGAKSAGKNQFSYFTQAMDDRAHMRLRVSTELRRAISANQLSLLYQPVIDLHDGHVVKTEALLRWNHPKLGSVSPAVFIPIAEEAGLMADIGNWVFREAAARTKCWGDMMGKPFRVALNKSPVQFNRRYMESHWLEYLRDIDLPPSSIVVEITEGLLLDATPEVSSKLLEYRDAGIQVAIDDFGTGYSSMAYLKEFDIDYLKIDQSFVRGIPTNAGHCTIAETIIVMAHKLGQMVIAEGIETVEQAEFLARVGCDFGQGFYFSPPLAADLVEGVLHKRYTRAPG